MSEHYDFHYQPTGSGAISGQQVLQQTEDAINELGDYVNDNVGGAMDVAQQALETAQNAEQDAQTALDTANSFSDAIQSAQQDASTALSTAQTAQTTATNANNTAIQASQDASTAVTTANNASGQVSTLSGTVTTLGQRVTTAEGNIGQNTSDITALTTRVGTAEGNITTLQNDVTIAQGNASSAMATAGTVKQQAYVLRYSSSSVTDNSTVSYSTLDNTDNIKSGDKVIDVAGKIFSVVSVDTTNQTVTVGSALIDLALDGNVVHTSGNENVAGIKNFTDDTYIKSLNFTNEVPSPSSSSSSILPIITTITYGDSSPSVQARLDLRVTADGIKSLYPHENLAYSLGLASRSWSDFYTYHGYFRGQQQNDEYSGNARTNLTLLANRDSVGQSGCVVDTFRANTKQGTGMHILGFGMKEDSVRYEGIRFQWVYDSVNIGYNFNVRPNRQGTNTPLTYNLGTSSDRWNDVQTNAINGLEPSALGMPDLSNGIDISSYITDLAGVNNEYTPTVNGWICVRSGDATKISILDAGTNIGNQSVSSTATYLTVMTPCIANKKVYINLVCTSLSHAYFVPCQGNV